MRGIYTAGKFRSYDACLQTHPLIAHQAPADISIMTWRAAIARSAIWYDDSSGVASSDGEEWADRAALVHDSIKPAREIDKSRASNA